MKLKTVEVEGTVYGVVEDGKPVFEIDGKDTPVDYPHAAGKIRTLNAEAKTHREAKEAAEAKLKAFEGIDDAAAALEALKTVKSLDDKKLVDAGEVDRLKEEATKPLRDQLKKAEDELTAMTGKLHDTRISHAFAQSTFIRDQLAVPLDMVRSTFAGHFSINDDGKLVAKDFHGNLISSKERFEEPADFEEAISHLVGAYPHKDKILKSNGGGGSGSSAVDEKSTGRRVKRSEFEAMTAGAQAKVIEDVQKGDATIVD